MTLSRIPGTWFAIHNSRNQLRRNEMKTKIEKKQDLVKTLEKKNLECAARGSLQSELEVAEFISINKQLTKASQELRTLKTAEFLLNR